MLYLRQRRGTSPLVSEKLLRVICSGGEVEKREKEMPHSSSEDDFEERYMPRHSNDVPVDATHLRHDRVHQIRRCRPRCTRYVSVYLEFLRVLTLRLT